MGHAGQEDVDAGRWEHQFISEGLLVRHDEFVLGESLANGLSNLLEEIPLLVDRDGAVATQLSEFGDEIVEIHHVEAAIVDDLFKVLTLFHGDIMIKGILTRLACKRPETDPKTISF